MREHRLISFRTFVVREQFLNVLSALWFEMKIVRKDGLVYQRWSTTYTTPGSGKVFLLKC